MQAKSKVLVVDDDDDIRDVLALALDVMGYQVETARDGADAIEHLSTGSPPIAILLDMMMPKMDGEAVLDRLRRSSRLSEIPVILLSGHNAARQKAEELHAAACLVKPIDLDQLIDAVKLVTAKPEPKQSGAASLLKH